MFGLSILTAAWWAAKGLLVREAAGRFLSGTSLGALAIMAAAVSVVLIALVGGVMFWQAARSSGAEVSDATWKERNATARWVKAWQQKWKDEKAAKAIDEARRVYIDRIRENSEYAASLEREIADLKAKAMAAGKPSNPIIYPRSLARELRK